MKKLICKKSICIFLLIVALLLVQFTVFSMSGPIKRPQAKDQYKWNLAEIYPNKKSFYVDVDQVQNQWIPKFKKYKGRLNTADHIFEVLKLHEKTSRKIMKAYIYAKLTVDLDQTNDEAVKMTSKVDSIYSEYQEKTAFITPEILKMPEEKIKKMMRNPKLAIYKNHFNKLLKGKKHVLSEKEAVILSLASTMFSVPRDIFDKVTLADIEEITIEDKDGKNIRLTGVAYRKVLENSDRSLRKRAFKGRLETYEKVNNTLGATYIAEIKKNIFLAKARKYNSAIEASMASEGIDPSIYKNLVDSVNNHLNHLHKYYALRKKVMRLDKLYGYDTSVPLTKNYTMNVSYDESVKIIEKALQPLGKKYVADFKKGINSRWVDVYEDDHKYTGAYQWGSYDTHPYILMNYDQSLNSALTLAHEMGHALNTKYSNENQEYINAAYPIFTAEVASTANELLVMDYLIKNAKTDKEKLYLINQQIEQIKGTVYRQTMFSEFEKKAHEMVEAGKPISTKVLNDLWLSLLKKYNGSAYTVDEVEKVGWSRIPHFYMNFYVYKYATSISASYSIVNKIKEGEKDAVKNYLTFLGSGGSDDPVETLKNAGVDMNTSKPINSILMYFGELVDEMERLLKKQGKM